jgi:hypothetical protein
MNGQYFSKLFILCLSVFFVLFQTSSAQASYNHNVRGEAKIVGGSIEFDGSGSNINLNINNAPVESGTLLAWIKIDDWVNTYDSIIFKGPHSSWSGIDFGIFRNSDQNVFLGTLNDGTNNMGNAGPKSSVITPGVWYMLVFTWNGTVTKFYTNNIETGSFNWAHGAGDRSLNMRFGSNVGGTNYYLDGLIDDVRIYDRALSEEEVTLLYQGRDVSDGLAGHWRFDEGYGLVAFDSSGNDNDGSLLNDPQWSDDVPSLPDRYLYFNCIDEGTNRFPFTFPFYFSIDPCALEFTGHTLGEGGYGVSIDNDNIFSGYARTNSGSTGLVSFQAGIPDGESYNTLYNNCPTVDSGNCNDTTNCSACYDEEDELVYGWAKVIDNDEYFSLHDEGSAVGIYNYASSDPGYFLNYANYDKWGKMSFNCSNDSECDSDDYKVYRWDLKIREMSAPNWSYTQACSADGALKSVFGWQLASGEPTHYELKLSTNSEFTTATSSGKQNYSNNFLACPGDSCPSNIGDLLDYKTSYYWWLKLYDDDNGIYTDWVQFDHSGEGIGNLTSNQDYNDEVSLESDLTFTTYRHEFPSPFFSWFPENIIAGTSTDFWVTDESGYYTDNDPNNLFSCYGDDCDASYLWTSNSQAVISSSTAATTSIIFTKIISNQRISLQMTDPTEYYCSTSSMMTTINYNLPLWREVKP